MTIEEAIRQRIIDVLAAGVPSPVHLDRLPQPPTYPCVRVSLVDDLDFYQQTGRTNLGRARVQVDAYARTASGADPYADATELAAVVDGDGHRDLATGLAGWRGTVAGDPPLQITGIFRNDRRRDYEGDELRVVKITQDYLAWYYHPPAS